VRAGGGTYNYNRRFNVKRQTPDENVQRSLRQQKTQMKEAVKMAKDAGTAVEYRGKLNRAALNCNSLNCTQISCDIGRLEKDEFVLVEIFSRLWVNTLIDDNVYEADISSLAFAQITSLPHAPKYSPPPQVIAVTTDVNPTDPEQYNQGIPWWLILLAILIALLILTLIILCCWKLGFFKRNRPPVEKAQYSSGAKKGDEFADSSARYAPPHMYSPERHGAKV
jgi:hypothetical protein